MAALTDPLTAAIAMGARACPPPFVGAHLYPPSSSGGFTAGRLCARALNTTCCLPCPHAAWLYSPRFERRMVLVSWINLPGLLCALFLVASLVVLPGRRRSRHQLNVCLVASVALMNIGFLVPLAAQTNPCRDAITPNDMTSSAACALSGTLIIAGGWLGVVWVGLITLALHLQICWDVVAGPVFTRATLLAGWSVPVVAVALALKLCGVSFRLAAGCHVNAANSLPVLWLPLLLLAALTLIVQLATFAYCGRVYFATLRAPPVSPLPLPPPPAARRARPLSPKDTYHHVRRLVQLQWRAILIVTIIVADIVFFAVVFLAMNRLEAALAASHESVRPWLVCLIATSGRADACSAILHSLRPNEFTLISVLALLSLNGFWCLLLLGRPSMIVDWWHLLSRRPLPRSAPLSVDPHLYAAQAPSYGMLAMLPHPGKLSSASLLPSPPEPAHHQQEQHNPLNPILP